MYDLSPCIAINNDVTCASILLGRQMVESIIIQNRIDGGGHVSAATAKREAMAVIDGACLADLFRILESRQLPAQEVPFKSRILPGLKVVDRVASPGLQHDGAVLIMPR